MSYILLCLTLLFCSGAQLAAYATSDLPSLTPGVGPTIIISPGYTEAGSKYYSGANNARDDLSHHLALAAGVVNADGLSIALEKADDLDEENLVDTVQRLQVLTSFVCISWLSVKGALRILQDLPLARLKTLKFGLNYNGDSIEELGQQLLDVYQTIMRVWRTTRGHDLRFLVPKDNAEAIAGWLNEQLEQSGCFFAIDNDAERRYYDVIQLQQRRVVARPSQRPPAVGPECCVLL